MVEEKVHLHSARSQRGAGRCRPAWEGGRAPALTAQAQFRRRACATPARSAVGAERTSQPAARLGVAGSVRRFGRSAGCAGLLPFFSFLIKTFLSSWSVSHTGDTGLLSFEDFMDYSRKETGHKHGMESVKKGKEGSGVRKTQTEPNSCLL